MVTRPRKNNTSASSSSRDSKINSTHHHASSMPGQLHHHQQQHASLPQNAHDTTNGKVKRSTPRSPTLLSALHRLFSLATSPSFTLTSLAAILASPLLDDDSLQPTVLQLAFGYLFLARPLLSALSVCLDSHRHDDSTAHERLIAVSFLAAIASRQLPQWTSRAAASSALLAFGLASRQRTARLDNPLTSSSSQRTRPRSWSALSLRERAALATLAVVLSLLLENFLIWVVSATYPPGIHGNPAPLQDNGRIVLEALSQRLFPSSSDPRAMRRKWQAIRDGLNVQWGIVAGLAASFVALELNVGGAARRGRSLAGLALRALLTLACARLVRTASFVLTVLPSQVPGCYGRHFPMPPESWGEWLMVGFLPNSRGGCNDLILSGHATVVTTLGCACTSVAGNPRFSGAVWTLVAVDFAIEAYQGLHYSVDMWLGWIVTCLLWQLTKGLEEEEQEEKNDGKKKDGAAMAKMGMTSAPLDRRVVAMYSLPAFLGFIILTFVSEAVVNYFLVGYAVWAGIIFAKWGFTNFSQHLLLCLLFVTLGSYL